MTAPFNTVYSDGGPPITGDGLNTFIQFCENVAAARGFIGTAGMAMYLAGTTGPGDGGQGVFYWNPTGTAADDSGITTIVPFGSTPGSGEWTRSPTASSFAHGMAVFAGGASTFIVPANVTQVKARLWGGGGGGGGCVSNSSGSGGGGGGYAEGWLSVTPLASIPVIVGTGGVGGASGGGNGGPGGTTSFLSLSASGGGPGLGNEGGGGVAGTGSGIGLLISGYPGELAGTLFGSVFLTPAGGAAFAGRGGPGVYGNNGRAGSMHGDGGSGAAGNGSAPFFGGFGNDGSAVLEW